MPVPLKGVILRFQSVVAVEAHLLGQTAAFRVADEKDGHLARAVAQIVVNEDSLSISTRGVIGAQATGADLALSGKLGLAGVLKDT
jgi:hypothetical protein